jgi:hypothetical protein
VTSLFVPPGRDHWSSRTTDLSGELTALVESEPRNDAQFFTGPGHTPYRERRVQGEPRPAAA